MRAGVHDKQISIWRKIVTQDPDFGTPIITRVPLVAQAGSPTVAERFWAEVQDALPSRAESVTQGLAVARNQTRIRMRWRNDVDSSMEIIVHGDTDVTYQIVGGPAEIEGRKERIEMMCERLSS
jgi:head-tail adaptor